MNWDLTYHFKNQEEKMLLEFTAKSVKGASVKHI